jgi:hypothetical protein
MENLLQEIEAQIAGAKTAANWATIKNKGSQVGK